MVPLQSTAPPAAVNPPADKKAKMEKVSDDFSLLAGLDAKVDTKPKTDDVRMTQQLLTSSSYYFWTRLFTSDIIFCLQGFSLDALSALSDTLPTDAPKPKLPEPRPEDIVTVGAQRHVVGRSNVFVF